MDKENFIAYLKRGEYLSIIHEYCLDKGKTEKLTNAFLTALLLRPDMALICADIAIRYYKEREEVLTLIDVSGKEIQYY